MLSRIGGWSRRTALGVPGTTRLNALLATGFSVIAVLTASGTLDPSNPQGRTGVCVAVLLMTLPVAWRRDYPLQALTVLAFGAVFNWLVVGSYVRCGGALPSLFLVLFSVADRLPLRAALVGEGLALVSALSQAQSDPRLKGFTVGAFVMTALLWGAGRLVRSRQSLVTALQARTEELREQRESTARLAVLADRARVARELDEAIGERLGSLAGEAAGALAHGAEDVVGASLEQIERSGRRTLTEMREIVGALRDEPPIGPQPSLDDLDALFARIGPGERVTVRGRRSRLPAGVELSAYRIVERLTEALEDVPGARVAVALRYAPDAFELRVTGMVRPQATLQTAVGAAREWVALHAGALESEITAGLAVTNVRLPLVTAHV